MGARFPTTVQTGPGAHPASYTMGTRSFPEVTRPGHGVDHPPSSSAEVKGRVELYLCSPCGPSWPVLEWNLPLSLPHGAHIRHHVPKEHKSVQPYKKGSDVSLTCRWEIPWGIAYKTTPTFLCRYFRKEKLIFGLIQQLATSLKTILSSPTGSATAGPWG